MAKLSFAQKLKGLFSRKNIGEEFYEDLTDALIEGDISARHAVEIVDRLEKECREKKLDDEKSVTCLLKSILLENVRKAEIALDNAKTNVWMILGVNGVGKTTSVAKMAKLYHGRNVPVIMAASDTFRAAAVDQLSRHGETLGIRVVKHQMGSDPSAVVFDAADACRANGGGLVLADTAGRLHNKENLVNELKKIDRICSQKADPDCYRRILVLDATTGQNAVRQAEVFSEAVGIDALILTKYDSTAKGGCIVSIGRDMGIPVLYVCTGEKHDDIAAFDPEKYVNEFLGIDE